ncbi:hypothetical protein LEN26_016714 [Aphanomyces euteiches]|nr:hypothetical protein LEN26_016714 [Aphanomyces euteiches]KAH9120087.1 hypothetical protein AeMF1_007568 [Aphanomyces euteiches]
MVVFESASTRYDLQLVETGQVQVRIPHPKQRVAVMIMVLFLGLWIGVGTFVASKAPVGFTIFASCIIVVGVLSIGIKLADIECGYELIVVSETAWSYTRSYGCFKTTKHYDIKLMGPLKSAIVTVCSHDESRHQNRTRKCFGFDYGGRTILMGACLLETEIEPLINHLAPHLPNHLKP